MKPFDQVLEQLFELLVTRTRLERRNLRSIYLAQFGEEIIPFCFRFFRSSKKAEVRSDLLDFIYRYARSRPDVVDFAIAALADRSAVVRRSACATLAYSLDVRCVEVLTTHAAGSGEPTATYARNAVTAIQKKNHNLYYPEYDGWIVVQDDPEDPKDEEVDYYIKKRAPSLVGPLLRILGSLYGKYSCRIDCSGSPRADGGGEEAASP